MKRSINRWTTTMATAAILGLPVVGVANTRQDPAPQQQPQPTQPQAEPPQQPTPQPTEPRQPEPGRPQPTDPQPQPAQEPQSPPSSPSATQRDSDETVSPQEHLSQAKQAADSITTTSVPAKSRSQLAQLKQHLSALSKSESASPGTASGTAGAATASWGTDVAAIDKIITEMVGVETTGATTSTPGATGTSGSKAAGAVALDDETRSKLMEVRAHITAYAAAKAGATAPTSGERTPPPAAGAETQSQTPAAGAQPTEAQPGIDVDAARRHLMAARESLSELTQLPAATQLTGEARTQVAQLISNFNELITAQSNWRASYAKVNSNLTALIGPENGDAEATGGAEGTAATAPSASAAGAAGAPATGEAPATATAPGAPAGTAGSVGTSGSTRVEIDPAIRAKLVEFRENLTQFQKASGGAEK